MGGVPGARRLLDHAAPQSGPFQSNAKYLLDFPERFQEKPTASARSTGGPSRQAARPACAVGQTYGERRLRRALRLHTKTSLAWAPGGGAQAVCLG